MTGKERQQNYGEDWILMRALWGVQVCAGVWDADSASAGDSHPYCVPGAGGDSLLLSCSFQ